MTEEVEPAPYDTVTVLKTFMNGYVSGFVFPGHRVVMGLNYTPFLLSVWRFGLHLGMVTEKARNN